MVQSDCWVRSCLEAYVFSFCTAGHDDILLPSTYSLLSLRDIQSPGPACQGGKKKSSITGLYNEYLWHWISIISKMKVYDFSWCSSANRAQSTSAAFQPAPTHANTDGWADEGKSGPEENDVLNHDFCSTVLKILIDTPIGGMMSTSSSIMKVMSSPKQEWRAPKGSDGKYMLYAGCLLKDFLAWFSSANLWSWIMYKIAWREEMQ